MSSTSMAGTERLEWAIKAYMETRLKPEGMCSKLFWELNKILEVKHAESYAICRNHNASK